jgi:1-phosphofructokinase family hexose kinase
MILTVTLNPSLDLTLSIRELKIGKVHRSEKEFLIPGGKGINISKVLKIFNEDTFILGFSGGITGTILEKELEKREIPFEFIKIKENVRFAIGIIEKENTNSMTIINGIGPKIYNDELLALKERFRSFISRAKFVVLSGSLPQGIPQSIYRDLFKMIENPTVIKVLDAKGIEFKIALSQNPHIIKPNQEEAEEFLGFPLKDEKALIKAGKFFRDMNIKYSIISLGERGAFLSTENEMFIANLPPIKGYNWGTGDAFLAGFILGIKRENDPIYALKLACSTAYIKVKKIELKRDDIPEILENIEKVQLKKID